MPETVKAVWNWLDEHLEETILIILLLAITLLTGMQVVMRRVFNDPLTWSEELCRYCFMWSGFIGIGYCVRRRCEIRIDTFVSLLSGRARSMLSAAANLISLVVYAFFTYFAFSVTNKSFASAQTSPAIGIPIFVVYIGLAAGFLLAAVRQFQVMAFHAGRSLSGKDGQDGKDKP